MSSVTKPIMLNETGEQIVQKLTEVAESNKAYEKLLDTKADKVDVSAPFNFKGDTTYASLPTSGNEINDTYYCSDKKCRYTWNGKGWFQSSMNEVDYTDELAKMGEDLEAGMSQLSSDIAEYEFEGTHDMLNKMTWTKGQYISNDGSFANHQKMYLSEPLDVSNVKKIIVTTTEKYNLVVAQYDASNAFVEGGFKSMSYASTFEIEKLPNAKYIVASIGDWSTLYDIDTLLLGIKSFRAETALEKLNNTVTENHADYVGFKAEVIEKLDKINIGDFRVLIASDLHMNAEHLDSKYAGISHRYRMMMLVNAVNAEHQLKHVDAMIILGDFQDGYGKVSATYFKEHYAPQIQVPVYAFAGDHDYYSNEEWKEVWGTDREFSFDIGDVRFIFVDVYKNTIGQKDENGKTVLSVLDEEHQRERISGAKADGKKVVVLCHSQDGIMESAYTTAEWRSFLRANATAVFYAHTHNVVVDNHGYGELMFYNVGNFSYPPNANWDNLDDGSGTYTRRYGFRNYGKESDNSYTSRMIYPYQKLEIGEEVMTFDYTLGEKHVIREI